MDSDFALALLKAAGAIAGGVLGIAGLFSNFISEKGTLTRTGKAVLAGIILASGIGVVTSIIEAYKAKSESEVQAARTERLLHHVNRTLQPITRIRASFQMEIPKGFHAVVNEYSATVKKFMELNFKQSWKYDQPGISIEAWDWRRPTRVSISEESELWPRGRFSFIGELAKSFYMGLGIQRVPFDTTKVPSLKSGKFDLVAVSAVPLTSKLYWDLNSDRLSIVVTSEFDRKTWVMNGKVVSELDIVGSQIVVFPPSANLEFAEKYFWARHPFYKDFAERLSLNMMTLSLAEGRTIRIRGEHFIKSYLLTKEPVFVVNFPKNEKEFERATANTRN